MEQSGQNEREHAAEQPEHDQQERHAVALEITIGLTRLSTPADRQQTQQQQEVRGPSLPVTSNHNARLPHTRGAPNEISAMSTVIAPISTSARPPRRNNRSPRRCPARSRRGPARTPRPASSRRSRRGSRARAGEEFLRERRALRGPAAARRAAGRTSTAPRRTASRRCVRHRRSASTPPRRTRSQSHHELFFDRRRNRVPQHVLRPRARSMGARASHAAIVGFAARNACTFAYTSTAWTAQQPG